MLYVVIGPPAAGKSTWIEKRASASDAVIDYDRIAVALSGPGAPSHGHAGPLGDIAYRAREAAVTEALKHSRELDVYVIHSVPSPHAIRRYLNADAEVVRVDPGRSVVMERCKSLRDQNAYRAVERWYSSPELHRFPVAPSFERKGPQSRRW
jgi:hypothetical protein